MNRVLGRYGKFLRVPIPRIIPCGGENDETLPVTFYCTVTKVKRLILFDEIPLKTHKLLRMAANKGFLCIFSVEHICCVAKICVSTFNFLTLCYSKQS